MKCKTLSLGAILLLASTVGHAQSSTNLLQGDVRLKATFETGKPELDIAPGDKQLSRIWGGEAYNKAPDNAYPGKRFALQELLEAGHNSQYSFATKTDAGFRVTGAFNLQSGTFAGWFRKSDVLKKGGLLLAAKAWPTGGPRGTIHWALGIGGAPGSDVPAHKLFVVADGVQSIATDDLPDAEWVHLTAVWDAAHGAKLYANGQLLADHWSATLPSTSTATTTPPLYPAGNFVDELAAWRASSGTAAGRKFAPLLEEGAFPGVKVSRVKSAVTNQEVLRLENGSSERLQVRSAKPLILEKGSYRVFVRVRRDTEKSGAGNAKDVSVRSTLSGPTHTNAEISGMNPVAGAPATEIQLEQTVTFNADDRLVFDLNFNNPGTYYIEDFSVRAAQAPEVGGRTKTTLKLPGGTTPFVTTSGSYPVERFHLMPAQGGAVDNLIVCDFPLNAQGVQALFAGKTPEYSQAEKTLPDPAARLAELGWNGAPAAGFIPLVSGRNLNVWQAAVALAKENHRAAGWLAVDGFPHSQSPWWYHGYWYLQKKIHLAFDKTSPVNYIAAQGTFKGTLENDKGQDVVKIQPTGALFGQFLDKPLAAQNVTLRQDEGLLDEIGFYSIAEGAAEKTGRELSYELQVAQNEIPLQGAKRNEFVSAYPVRERSTLVGVVTAAAPAAPLSIPALQTFHLMTPPMADEFALGAIGVTLRGQSAANSARLRVVAHDARTPWRELARLDFVLQKSQPQFKAIFNLDLRDTLIRQGDNVWLSVVCDTPLELSTGASSTITLRAAADVEHAAKLWRDWELNSVRDRFESLSEPRPWHDAGPEKSASSWLAVTTPEYEGLDNGLRVLRERFPNDKTVNSWFSYTHPKDAPNPAKNLPLPEIGARPRWAVLLKENLHLYKQFLNWWIDNRRDPNGEWGHFYGDDTDLLQDWLDGALISDPDGRIGNALDHTADSIWKRFEVRGQPVIVNGLNSRWTDLLHAYEDGLNIQPQAFLHNYGDPELLARLMATAARYDGFLMTPPKDGKRQFAGSSKGTTYFSSTRAPEGNPEDRAWFLLTHPGLVLSWYNGHPATLKILREIAAGRLDSSLRDPNLLAYGGTSFYYGLYRMTGDERYLRTLVDQEQRKNGVLAPIDDSITGYSLFELPGDYDRKKTFDWLHQDAATRYDKLGTEAMGWGDTRFERNWAEWYLTKDKSHLNEGLEQLYRKMKYVMPSVTEAEQSGDRVAISKQLISRAYLGGVPSARNHSFYPDYAVSYQGLSDDFAALVTENQTDALQVSFYNFEERAQNGAMKVWNLQPGKYELTAGPDANGDDKMDKAEVTQQYTLERGAEVSLSLPSQKTWVVRLRLLEKTTPLTERVDAGVSSKLLRRDGSTLHVPVFNTGTKPIARLKVRLRSSDGKQQQERIIENLQGSAGWTLASQEVQFTLAPDATSWFVELDPDGELEEITRANNRASL